MIPDSNASHYRTLTKFGADVVSKTPTAMTNEVICKLICHNLTCLIQEQEALGIVPVFWQDEDECRAVMGAAATVGGEAQR